MDKALPDIDWSLCTWEGSRRAQHQAFAKLSFRAKMEAVEQACELSRKFLAARHKEGLPYIDPQTKKVVRPGKPGGQP